MQMSLAELSMHHPVLAMVQAEQDLEHNELLQAYVRLLVTSHQDVPATMTELYGGYVNYVVKRNTHRDTKEEAGDNAVKDTSEIFNQFGHLAYDSIVKRRKLTPEVLEKHYQIAVPPVEENDSTSQSSDSILGTYGLLVRDRSTKKGVLAFRDNLIRDYLGAHYQLAEVTRKIQLGRRKLISSSLIESVRQLPATGDLWRMTLGLMVKCLQTRQKQRHLMVELLDYCKTLVTMSSYDMTSLCVEAVYESRLSTAISRKTLDDFTLNQTVNFSNVKVRPHRLNYTVAAVGHLVRTNGEVFGLHLANFGINESNIHLLADPLNVISDNSLQVLNLSGNELGEAGIIKLERFLVKASLLTHLDLSSCLLFDAGVIALSNVLSCLQLIYLNLAKNGITDIGMKEVINNLLFCPSLEFLHISGNRLTDKSAIALAEVIKMLPRIRSLDLRRNEIGEDGVRSVSENSKNLKPLSETEKKRRSVRSLTVWKTRSARLSNFSLRKVPMGGVLKRSSQTTGTTAKEGADHLPEVTEEDSEVTDDTQETGQKEDSDTSWEGKSEKREIKRHKIRSLQRLRQIERAQVRRKNSAPV